MARTSGKTGQAKGTRRTGGRRSSAAGGGAPAVGQEAKGGRKGAGPARGKRKAAAAARPASGGRWALWTGLVVLGALALRLAVVAFEPMPAHFDEAQYWAYGQELAWGYFSKPPGVGAVIRAATELFGDRLWAIRLPSPLAHAAIAWLVFLVGRRLFDGRTGFWAAAGYTAAPGVTASAMIVSTDPIMMVAWAGALYALVRAREAEGLGWWILLGVLIGLGALAKYTMLAFGAGALLWGLFSAPERAWRGAGAAALSSLVVLAPNLVWNAANGFATVSHVAEDADPGGSRYNPGHLAEFLGAQLGVIGPVFLLAILAALWRRGRLASDARLALLAWQTYTLLLPMIALAFVTRAQPNWAAPAYVAGAILAAHWLLARDWRKALVWGQAGLGALAAGLLYGLAALYAVKAEELPRVADPFKKMRIGAPLCERALGVMAEEGIEVLLSDSRRRLSECMFIGGMGWDRIAVWNPDLLADNHHELVATLSPGDDRRMLLMVLRGGEEIAARFAEAERLEQGRLGTHADRSYPYSFWVVQGFEDYGRRY